MQPVKAIYIFNFYEVLQLLSILISYSCRNLVTQGFIYSRGIPSR